ncbi:hypothetical protein PENTCL1PPCAC_21474 [Pristionchus entomophagus]|uniref:Secreted protein n=1 Tax=Pristionchus entomophagus TaxID=358040 RepID=A0AAV5TXU2_9BILA|nr:hypothetical protein PENTCL1PPCAC_21474 [Pristionchus entomophagus]
MLPLLLLSLPLHEPAELIGALSGVYDVRLVLVHAVEQLLGDTFDGGEQGEFRIEIRIGGTQEVVFLMAQFLLQHLLGSPVLPFHLRYRVLVKIVEESIEVHPARGRLVQSGGHCDGGLVVTELSGRLEPGCGGARRGPAGISSGE